MISLTQTLFSIPFFKCGFIHGIINKSKLCSNFSLTILFQFSKDLLWAITVGIFEFGYWALSSTLGLNVTINYIFINMSFTSSLLLQLNILLSGYWILIAVCIIINSFGEVAGPIYLNIQGPISLKTLAGNKEII